MKNSTLTALTLLLFAVAAQAQRSVRIGYVDMDYILANVPEYQEATAQLEEKVLKWKSEIELELNRIEAMKTALENERPLLTQELIEDREEEIRYEEEQLLKYQQQRFGPSGDLMRQKLQLVKPVQDQVFIAVQEIAEARAYDFIFDKSSEVVMLYADKTFDVSDQVLRLITRASSREEIRSRAERQELLREEGRTPEQNAAVQEREAARDSLKNAREALLEERRRERDSIRNARQEAFEARRKELLEERERKQDSIQKAREEQEEQENNKNINSN